MFLTLSLAVPTVLPLTLAVKVTLHEPDLLPHVTVYFSPDPATVAMSPDEHALSLKLKALPLGPDVFTVASGLDHDRLSVHGLIETPWSTWHFAASIGMANNCICEIRSGTLDEMEAPTRRQRIRRADPRPREPLTAEVMIECRSFCLPFLLSAPSSQPNVRKL